MRIGVDDVDRELLTGMGNCFAACGEPFEGTVGMVASSRGRSDAEVISALRRIRATCGEEPEYQRLRARFPDDFPV